MMTFSFMRLRRAGGTRKFGRVEVDMGRTNGHLMDTEPNRLTSRCGLPWHPNANHPAAEFS